MHTYMLQTAILSERSRPLACTTMVHVRSLGHPGQYRRGQSYHIHVVHIEDSCCARLLEVVGPSEQLEWMVNEDEGFARL